MPIDALYPLTHEIPSNRYSQCIINLSYVIILILQTLIQSRITKFVSFCTLNNTKRKNIHVTIKSRQFEFLIALNIKSFAPDYH